MGHNQRVRTNLFTVRRLVASQLEVDQLMVNGDTQVVYGELGELGEDLTRTKLSTSAVVDELVLSELEISITDAGVTDGGYGAHLLITLPSSVVVLLGIYLDLSLVAGEDISATADVAVAIGSAAEEADSTLDSTSDDYVGSADCTLVDSEGSIQSSGPSAPALIDASAGDKEVFLNLGVPDADISDSSSITISGKVRLVYIDLSREA
jgi:hypothetical protein